MPGCHDHHAVRFDGASPAYRRALWAVMALNTGMFVVELSAGHLAGSKALQADALDFAADAATYAISLAVIGSSLVVRANAALLKGASLVVMAAFVLVSTVLAAFSGGVPHAPVMGVVGALALAANLASVVILMRWRAGDANVRSVWLCSRNDAIGNVAVMGAGGLVWLTLSPWPDLIVAAGLAALFLGSAFGIITQALAERREGLAVAVSPPSG